MIPTSVITYLIIRYVILCTYILAIYGLIISVLNNVFQIKNDAILAYDKVYKNCSIYHGIQKNTYIITGISSLMWVGPVYWHIHLAYTQWNILTKNVISLNDNWVLKHKNKYVYYNIWLFLFSICYLPNLAMQLHDCNTPLLQKLIAIHCLNIIPIAVQFGMYLIKIVCLGILVLNLYLKYLMFKTYTANGWRLRESTNREFSLIQVDQTPNIETIVQGTRSVQLQSITGDKQCAICMEDNVPVMATLECKHEMCITCCKEWLETHTTCPFCRDNLAIPETQELNAVNIETTEV